MFKLYVWAHGDRGWLGEAAALSIHMVPHPPQRATGKQMLMRHLTFSANTLPPAAVWNNCQIYRKDWQQCKGKRLFY